MAVAVNNSAFNQANSTSATVSLSCGGSDRALAVCLKASNNPTISSPVVDGSPLTLIHADTLLDVYVYYFLAPTAGTRSISITMNAVNEWGLLVAALTGVHQTVPIGTAVNASNTEQPSITSPSVTGVTDGLVLDFAALVIDAITPGGGQTRYPGADPRGDAYFGGFVSIGMSTKSAVGSTTTSWAATGGSTFGDNKIVAVPFLPSAGGGGSSSTNQRMILLGVG